MSSALKLWLSTARPGLRQPSSAAVLVVRSLVCLVALADLAPRPKAPKSAKLLSRLLPLVVGHRLRLAQFLFLTANPRLKPLSLLRLLQPL